MGDISHVLTVNHPYAKSVRVTVEFGSAGASMVVCVETDLALSASDPRYDGPAIQELLEAVTVQAAEQNCHFNVLRFVEISEAGGEVCSQKTGRRRVAIGAQRLFRMLPVRA
jgi:hypothetical protein